MLNGKWKKLLSKRDLLHIERRLLPSIGPPLLPSSFFPLNPQPSTLN
jgi:hypothetical protein